MQTFKILANEQEFKLEKALFDILPKCLQVALQAIINQNKNLPAEDLEQIVINLIEEMSIGLNDYPGNMLMHSLLKPNSTMEFFYKNPYSGFLYLFEGLAAVNKFDDQKKTAELENKLQQVKKETLEKIIAMQTTKQQACLLKKALDVAAAIIVEVVSGFKIVKWLKKYITRSSEKHYDFFMHEGLRNALPRTFWRAMIKEKAYVNRDVFVQKMAELLGKDVEIVKKNLMIDIYWTDRAFIKKFEESTDKLKILKEFFAEFYALYECSEKLENQQIKMAINEAKEIIKKDLRDDDPELTTEQSKMVLDFIETVFNKVFVVEASAGKKK